MKVGKGLRSRGKEERENEREVTKYMLRESTERTIWGEGRLSARSKHGDR